MVASSINSNDEQNGFADAVTIVPGSHIQQPDHVMSFENEWLNAENLAMAAVLKTKIAENLTMAAALQDKDAEIERLKLARVATGIPL